MSSTAPQSATLPWYFSIAARLPDERIKQLAPVVARIAEDLTRRLGGRWPLPY